jgi:hypothetical protein
VMEDVDGDDDTKDRPVTGEPIREANSTIESVRLISKTKPI